MVKTKNIPWMIFVILLVIINIVLTGVIINQIMSAEDTTNSSENKNLNSNEIIIGNPNAKITITEYSDFECPFCKRFYSDAYAQIKTEYIDTGKVKIVFKHFPLTNIHQNALNAAIAIECANEQKKAEDMHDKLFESTSLTSDNLKKYAEEIGLDSTKFNECLDSQKYKDKVLEDQKEGVSKGVSGTPTLFVNQQKIVGAQPFSVFKTAIDTELAK